MTDTDWLALADRLWATTDMMYGHEAMVDDVTAGDLRAAADGLRHLAAITAERDQLRAERTQLTGDSMTDLKMTYAYEAGHEDGKAEVREQLDAITAALGAIDRTWDGYTLQPKDVTDRVERTRLLARGQIAASLSPTPSDVTAELNCPECGGYGWFAEHDPNTGEPMIPQPCPTCDQSGKVTAHVVDHIERLPF